MTRDLVGLDGVLSGNSYPGRVVGCARTGDGEVVAFYALTGRSTASRSRRLAEREEGGVAVASTGPAAHDPLRHYLAVTTAGRWLVVGNGEQVAVTAERLGRGVPPVDAVNNLSYEPDPPLYTSRITVVCDRDRPGEMVLAAVRRPRAARSAADVLTLTVTELAAGDVVLLTTYQSDGEQVSVGAPYLEARSRSQDSGALLAELWRGLPADLRVAAVVARVAAGSPRYDFRHA